MTKPTLLAAFAESYVSQTHQSTSNSRQAKLANPTSSIKSANFALVVWRERLAVAMEEPTQIAVQTSCACARSVVLAHAARPRGARSVVHDDVCALDLAGRHGL